MTALPVLTSKRLDVPGVRHAFFTRKGGVSQGIYASLNVGLGSNDNQDAVIENRRRCAAHFDEEDVVTAIRSIPQSPWSPTALACRTAAGRRRGQRDLWRYLYRALAADCAPVLFVDPQAASWPPAMPAGRAP